MSPMSILHLNKNLSDPTRPSRIDNGALRNYRPTDLPAWLAMRNRAVAELIPMPRPWTEADFHRQMTAADGWRNDCTWVAETNDKLVGSVTLARRGSLAVVHWLVVDPAWRRQGIAGRLMAKCEQAAWQQGHHQIGVETHKNWRAAVEFYMRLGYSPASR
jgi:GNAT superfamily N-acetyltransferase